MNKLIISLIGLIFMFIGSNAFAKNYSDTYFPNEELLSSSLTHQGNGYDYSPLTYFGDNESVSLMPHQGGGYDYIVFHQGQDD